MCFVFAGHELPTLKDLVKHVVPLYAADWREIGFALGLPNSILKIIKADNPTSVRDCCYNVFKSWIGLNPDASWKIVLNAINSLTVSNGMYVCV